MDFHVIIPVRYGATRFPGKPLVDIAGKPMVQHVYENAVEMRSTMLATFSECLKLCAASKRVVGPVVVQPSTVCFLYAYTYIII